MMELAKTLAALQTKFEAVSEVNTKFEAMLHAEERRRQSYVIATAKQLARTEVLVKELEKAQERERALEERNRGLQVAMDGEIGRIDEMLATHRDLVCKLQPLLCFAPSPPSERDQHTGLVFQ